MRLRILTILIALAALVSCQHRPLHDPDFSTKINVNVNISAVANITCDVYNDKIPVPEMTPEVMRVLFFDTEKDKLLAESFITEVQKDATGQISVSGELSILPGEYRLLIYQFGTESTMISDYDSWDNAEAYTDPLSDEMLKSLALKATAGQDDQLLRYQPDHVLVARNQRETIPYHSGVHTIHAEASTIVESYYLQVKVEGLEYVSSSRAILTSMSPAANMVEATATNTPASAIYIPLLKSDDKGVPVICNVFNTFGRIPESTNELIVTFELRTVDGRLISKNFDISDKFLSEECLKHHWLLIEEAIVVPPPENPDPDVGGGFDPSVGDWENEYHEIEM